LNPEFGITNEHVTASDIAEVFESDYSSLKTINPYLHVDTKKALVKLYWKIYGLIIITNNEFMLWLVKGYIAQLKGNLMKWAIATITIAKEKAHKQQVNGLKSGSINLSDFNWKG